RSHSPVSPGSCTSCRNASSRHITCTQFFIICRRSPISLRQSQACSGGVSSFIRSELSVVFLQVILCPACKWWLPLAFGYFTLQSCRAGISAESRRSELRRFALSDLAQP